MNTSCEDIILSLEYKDLSAKQAKALLKSLYLLEDIFKDFEKCETDHIALDYIDFINTIY